MSLFLRHNPRINTIEIIQLIDAIGLEVYLTSEPNVDKAAKLYQALIDQYNSKKNSISEANLKLLTLDKKSPNNDINEDNL